jgi:hypothetical protein
MRRTEEEEFTMGTKRVKSNLTLLPETIVDKNFCFLVEVYL